MARIAPTFTKLSTQKSSDSKIDSEIERPSLDPDLTYSTGHRERQSGVYVT